MSAGRTLLLIIFSLLAVLSKGQQDARRLYEGNLLYERDRLAEAVTMYRQALEANPANRKANFNLGDAIYKSAGGRGVQKVIAF